MTLTVSDPDGLEATTTVEFTTSSASSIAAQQIMDAATFIESLAADQFNKTGNQAALIARLTQAVSAIDKGYNAKAIRQLNRVIKRSNGCAATGTADAQAPGRDWIIDCTSQAELLSFLEPAVAALTATTSEAEQQIMSAAFIAAGLTSEQFISKQHKQAFITDLHQAAQWVRKGKTSKAISQLEQLIEQSEQCGETSNHGGQGHGHKGSRHSSKSHQGHRGDSSKRGGVITDCAAQASILTHLQDALAALTP